MGDAAESGERLIKRYGNRKLYDLEARRYVTLDALARMIGEGQDVCVVDQKTGEDLTNMVLAQVLLEGLRTRTARIPRQILTRLIRLGSSPGGAWTDWAPQQAAARARDEAEQIAARLIGSGRLSLEEALALRQEIAGSLQRLVGEAQRGIEQRLHKLLEPGDAEGGVATALQGLRDRLLAFETYLEPPAATAGGGGARRQTRRR